MKKVFKLFLVFLCFFSINNPLTKAQNDFIDSKIKIFDVFENSLWEELEKKERIMPKVHKKAKITRIEKSTCTPNFTISWAYKKDSNEKVPEFYDDTIKTTYILISLKKEAEFIIKYLTNKYEVSFDANGWKWQMSNQDFEYSVAKKLSKNTFTNWEKIFAGWSKTPDWEAEFSDSQEVKNLSEMCDVVTLYAVWKDKKDENSKPLKPQNPEKKPILPENNNLWNSPTKNLKLENDSRVSSNLENIEIKKEEKKDEKIENNIKNVLEKEKIISWKKIKYQISPKFDYCPTVENIVSDFNKDYKLLFRDKEKIKNLDEVHRLAKTAILNEKWVNNTFLFEPERAITRAEFLSILLKTHCFKLPGKVENLPYYDVKLDSWQAKVVKLADDLWIVKGYFALEKWTPFKPNKIISKKEALFIITKFNDIKILKNFDYDISDKKSQILEKFKYLWISNLNNYNLDLPLSRDEMVKLILEIIKLY